MKYKHCYQCGAQKNIRDLEIDFINISRLLCKICYENRECSNCYREFPVKYLLQDDFLPQLLCKNCYYYEIMMCERCEKMVYEYDIFEQKKGEMFCEKCDYYERVSNQQN